MSLKIIAGQFKGRLLKTPKGSTTRPSQSMLREALFNICQDCIADTSFLDLFAGSGAIGFEALSRGASHVTFVEKDKGAIQCIRENIALLKVETEAILYPVDYRVALKRLHKDQTRFDIVYVDPPYRQQIEPILEDLIRSDVLKPSSLLLVEQHSLHPKTYSAPGIGCINTRKFGDAVLQQYNVSDTKKL